MQCAEARPPSSCVPRGLEMKMPAAKNDRRRPNIQDHAASGKRHVLVVEDETVIGIDIQCLLEEHGYGVAGIHNDMSSALEFLQGETGKVDCAIVDIEIDGANCLPITAELDRLGVPYILVTGHNRQMARELGLDAWVIEKPFRDDQLASTLSALIPPKG